MFARQLPAPKVKSMAKQRSVEYIVDEEGRKKSVVMSYKEYLRLMENLDDLRVKMERQGETAEDFETALAELRNAGKV